MVLCSVSTLLQIICKLIMAENKERTFIMVKPDGVQRGLVGKIIQRFEEKGFKLVAMRMLWVSGSSRIISLFSCLNFMRIRSFRIYHVTLRDYVLGDILAILDSQILLKLLISFFISNVLSYRQFRMFRSRMSSNGDSYSNR